MAEVASSKSDAQGQFTFTSDAIGRGPMLIRATFQGVTFNTALPPGRPVAEVEVFEVSKDPKTITVVSHIVIFQPRDGNLLVGEEYIVQNNSQPAQAFFRTEGNFDFAIPPTAKLDRFPPPVLPAWPSPRLLSKREKVTTRLPMRFVPAKPISVSRTRCLIPVTLQRSASRHLSRRENARRCASRHDRHR